MTAREWRAAWEAAICRYAEAILAAQAPQLELDRAARALDQLLEMKPTDRETDHAHQ